MTIGDLFSYALVRIQGLIGLLLPSATKTIHLKVRDNAQFVPLKLPIGHRLAHNRRRFPLYDEFLPILGALVSERYPSATIVDVGANVGDTAALLRLHGCECRIISVEASQQFADIFAENASSAPHTFNNVELVRSFVGNSEHNLALLQKSGTATPFIVTGKAAVMKTRSLDEICDESVRLIKVDTDGYDHHVLASGQQFILKHSPILWFEADIQMLEDVSQWSSVLGPILQRYSYMVLFDNYGAPMVCTRSSLSELTQFLMYPSLNRFSGKKTFWYFDVCLFPDVEEELRAKYLQAISARLGMPWA